MIFIGNFLLFPVVKFFPNPLRFDNATTMSLVAPFFCNTVYFVTVSSDTDLLVASS